MTDAEMIDQRDGDAEARAELGAHRTWYSWRKLRKDLWWSIKWAVYFTVWTTLAAALLVFVITPWAVEHLAMTGTF